MATCCEVAPEPLSVPCSAEADSLAAGAPSFAAQAVRESEATAAIAPSAAETVEFHVSFLRMSGRARLPGT